MAEFSAKDVAALRKETGVGMMDCKKALADAEGDMEQAKQLLRERGLTKAGARSDRENDQGAVAIATSGSVAAAAQLRCETDFSAKSDDFVKITQAIADAALGEGEAAGAAFSDQIDDLKITKKENIELGRVVRIEAAEGNVLDAYLHVQDGRGVNAVLVELAGGTPEQAHDLAVHIAFARPKYLRREDVPAEVVEHERQTLETLSRNEGKPEAALPKIVEGRLNGFFKDVALLEQPYAKDDKQSVTQILGGAKVVRYAQVEIG